jgi:predicted  nucleic acid-binding Zn-ribbon protein
MLRNVVLSVATLVLGLTVASSAAAANTTAAQCEAMLGDVESARESLDSLERSVVEIDDERAELAKAIVSLEKKIAKAKGAAVLSLRAELDAATVEINLIDELRPEIVRQIEGLRTDIDATERGYISCIETVIVGG